MIHTKYTGRVRMTLTSTPTGRRDRAQAAGAARPPPDQADARAEVARCHSWVGVLCLFFFSLKKKKQLYRIQNDKKKNTIHFKTKNNVYHSVAYD
jgi:hypothetical protein